MRDASINRGRSHTLVFAFRKPKELPIRGIAEFVTQFVNGAVCETQQILFTMSHCDLQVSSQSIAQQGSRIVCEKRILLHKPP